MSPRSLLDLITTVSPFLVVAWHISPQTFVATLNQAAAEVVAARAQARSQTALGTLYCQLAAWEQATEAYLVAADWAKIARDPIEMGIAMQGLGTVMLYRQRYELARQCFNHAVQCLQSTHDHSQYAAALHSLGVAYYGLGSYPQALDLFQKALTLRGELWDVAGEILTLPWMGRVHCAQRQFAYALACYETALDLCAQHLRAEDQWFEAGLRCLIAELAEQCGHLDLAVGHYLDALKLVENQGYEWTFLILEALGQLHEQLGCPTMALYYRQQVLEVAQAVGVMPGHGNGGVATAKDSSTASSAQRRWGLFAPGHPFSLYF